MNQYRFENCIIQINYRSYIPLEVVHQMLRDQELLRREVTRLNDALENQRSDWDRLQSRQRDTGSALAGLAAALFLGGGFGK